MSGRITSVCITPVAMHVSRRFFASISVSLLLAGCVSPTVNQADIPVADGNKSNTGPVTESVIIRGDDATPEAAATKTIAEEEIPERTVAKGAAAEAGVLQGAVGKSTAAEGIDAEGIGADGTIANGTIANGIIAEVGLPGTQGMVAATEETIQEAPTDLWARIRAGFALNHDTDRKRVRQEIAWYQRNPEYIDRVTARASKHLFYIVEELEARNLPLEMALLPIVESAYDPFAYSHGRASGLWQFIPATARLYDIRIDWWYDGRRDIMDSTRAAIQYLERLYGMLKEDWLLALAAYNSGQGNLGKSIRRNKRAGKPIDFWSLKVLRETRSYVPRLLAISAIIAHPGKYGIKLKPIRNEAYWVKVDIDSQLDLARAADLAGMSGRDLYLLNPGFNQWSTHPDGPHRLLLPVDKADDFLTQLKKLPHASRMAWKRHKIKEGESLGMIAQRYHTTVKSIKATNNLRGNMIRTGRSLTIPVASKSSSYSMTSTARLKNDQKYFERKYGKEPIRYRVQNGDSFWTIARKYQIGMRELARWNGMGTTEMLHAGTELLIFNSPLPLSFASPLSSTEVIRKVNYRVRPGESLSLIANKFNLSLNKIKRWNQALYNRKYIQPGDRITLYVDVTATE